MAARRPESRSETPAEPGLPGPLVRSVVSLLLFLHLFCVAMSLSTNLTFSFLQSRVVSFLRPYLEVTNLGFYYAPFHLTHGLILDVDHRLEVLPDGADASKAENWRVLPDRGFRGGERYKRYQRLAARVAMVAERDQATSRIARDVAANFVHQGNPAVKVSEIRCRRHTLLLPDARERAAAADRDPWNANRFEVVYGATVLIGRRGDVDVVKQTAARETAGLSTSATGTRPDKSQDKRQEDK